jgi:ferrous iron transport protein A
MIHNNIDTGDTATIARLAGGRGCQRKLRTMGIREGKHIRVGTKHPFVGPLVVEVEGRKTTIGRGMAQKIRVLKV